MNITVKPNGSFEVDSNYGYNFYNTKIVLKEEHKDKDIANAILDVVSRSDNQKWTIRANSDFRNTYFRYDECTVYNSRIELEMIEKDIKAIDSHLIFEGDGYMNYVTVRWNYINPNVILLSNMSYERNKPDHNGIKEIKTVERLLKEAMNKKRICFF